MKKGIKGIGSAAIAIAFGLLVLAGYFFGHNGDGSLSVLGELQLFILNSAVILAGFAVLFGIINLCLVHFNKIRRKQKGAAYSVILVIALVVTFILGILAHYSPLFAGAFNNSFTYIQLPVETSLMALLAVTLTYASIRLLRRRLNLLSVVFLGSAFIILVGTVPWPFIGDIPFISDTVRPFFAQVLAASGARGILIGVGLGTLTTGLRVLFGADRPYGGK